MKKQLLILWSLLFSIISFAQTTLVNYPFTNTPVGNGLNYDVVDPSYNGGTIPFPTLTYHSNGGATKTPIYDNNMLRTSDGGDYLELTINTLGRSGLVLSFNADFQALAINGRWNVELDVGTGYEYFDQVQMWSVLGFRTNGNFSESLPIEAENIANLKIKITADSDALFALWNLRLDNLKITSGSPKIKIYSNATNAYIPHQSPSSLALDTDFGTRQTTDPVLTRTFRVRNFQGESGSKLKVSDITVTGVNPGDFTVSPTALADIDPTNNDNNTESNKLKTFTISFQPLGDGVRTAEINVYSNAAPSPYKFTVVGVGASCSLTGSDFASNTMAMGQQSLSSNYAAADLIGGQADNNPANTINIPLYPNNGDLLLSTSSPTAWYARGMTKEVQFGGPTGLDISGQKNVSIEFKVAAFTTTDKPYHWRNNPNTVDDPENGLNSISYVTLKVLKADNSEVEMTLKGSENTSTYRRNSFADGIQYLNNTFANSSITNAGTKRNSFRFNIPASAGIQNLKFKIIAYTNSNNRLWLIDDVKVVTSNAVYKTFTTGNVWSPSPPEEDEKAIIEGNYTNIGNPIICECEVAEGGVLTIPDNTSVTVKGKIVNDGIFTVESNASLIQKEDEAINTGDILVKRNLTFKNNLRKEYNYLISPVENANLRTEMYRKSDGTPVVAPSVLYHTESNNKFYNSTGAYIAGRSLAVKEPELSSGALATAFFTGKPFNGIIKYPLAYSGPLMGYNLVGNPYPSNIDLLLLYGDNNTEVESTFRFWDNTVNDRDEQQGSGYTGDAYAIFNAASGVNGTGLPAPGSTAPGDEGTKVPNKIVKVGQGFMVKAKGADKVLKYSNHIRLGDNTGSEFFGKQSPDDRYWLTMKAPSGIFSTIAMVYFGAGNNSFSADDSKATLISDVLYSIVQDEKVSINGRSSFADTDVIPLGTKHFVNGEYTIALGNKEGIFATGQNIYLKDTQTGIITNLSEGNYTFQANAGESTGRFEIIYKPQTILATDSNVREEIVVYRDAEDFVLKAQTKKITDVELYDTAGRLLYKAQPNVTKVLIPAQFLNRGVYLLKISQDTQVTIKKVIR